MHRADSRRLLAIEKHRNDMQNIVKTILIICLLSTSLIYAQIKPAGWETYSIPDVCSFSIPGTMEVRSDESIHGQFIKSVQQSSFFELMCNECDLFFDESELVLQPKGLNETPTSNTYQQASKSYARILFNFSYIEGFGQDDIKGMAPSDLREINQMWYEETKNEIECLAEYFSNSGDFKWYNTVKKNIAGLSALVIEYDRPGPGGATHVKSYRFFYDNKRMEITTSYKVSEESKYKDDFDTFIKLLKIETNVKPKKNQSGATNNGTYLSEEYHVKYSYDKTKYTKTPKQNKASHCFCKLESTEGFNVILFSAWDTEGGEDAGFSIHDDELIADTKQRDRDYCTDGKQLVKSCEKVSIGKTKALLTVLYYDVMGVRYVHTTYRAYHKGRFYTLDFHVPKEEYDKNKNRVNELIKGFQFI